MPEGEVGEKIIKLFKTEEKETSKSPCLSPLGGISLLTLSHPDVTVQTAMGEEAAIDAKEAPK